MTPPGTHCPDHSGHETTLNDHERRISEVEKAIIDIRDRLLARPSWAVLSLISLLTSAVVGLALYVITSGH